MERFITLGNWKILCDPEVNQEIYKQIPGSEAAVCGCAGCERFSQIRDDIYPQEFREILDQLGIDYKKEAEVTTFEEPGSAPLGGWFNFVGKACDGLDEMRKFTNTFRVRLVENHVVAQKPFHNKPKPLLQLEWDWLASADLIDIQRPHLTD